MPEVTTFTGPLSSMMKNGQSFIWRPRHQKCLESIKLMACRTPILRPIDPRSSEKIWVITDAAVYGQGPDWHNCRPAGFMSKKFTSAQMNYFTFEVEALAIIEALMKWEDKLIGIPFTVVTDHKALQFLRDKKKVSPRLERWLEYLSRFKFDTIYVKGETNKVADSLSRYYASEPVGQEHPPYDMVSADVRLDPEGEYLPERRIAELRMSRIISDVREPRREEARVMNPAGSSSRDNTSAMDIDNDPRAVDSQAQDPNLQMKMEGDLDLHNVLQKGYEHDAVCKKVLENPTHHERFRIREGLVEHLNNRGHWVLCVPECKHGRKRLAQIILEHAHTVMQHLGNKKTNEYVRRWFWWPQVARDIEKFCTSCGTCQTTKSSTQRPQGLLHSLLIPDRPWQSIVLRLIVEGDQGRLTRRAGASTITCAARAEQGSTIRAGDKMY